MQSTQITGSLLAVSASLFWTLAPFLFASAVRSIGAKRVNPLRLAGAALTLLLLSLIYLLFNRSALQGLQPIVIGWLACSGIIGLVIGDQLYLTALGFLGPRRTLQVLVLAPAFSVILAWLWLGERLTIVATIGIVVTLTALLLATAIERGGKANTEPGAFSWNGYLIALAATICHGTAAVFARKAFLISDDLNAIIATTSRIFASAVLIWIWVFFRGQVRSVVSALTNTKALGRLGAATLLGPILGMLCYVAAFKTAPAGVVSLLSSLSPILIIPISAWRYRTPVNYTAFLCMIMAIVGTIMVILK